MGWLGWTERDALNTDVNSILLAMEGKVEMMNPGAKARADTNVAAAKFRSFKRDHNIRWARQYG
jgi:hypothetical protein